MEKICCIDVISVGLLFSVDSSAFCMSMWAHSFIPGKLSVLLECAECRNWSWSKKREGLGRAQASWNRADLESNFDHQEAMCDEDMPALFQHFTKVSSTSVLYQAALLARCKWPHSYLSPGGAVRWGVGGSRPEGPQSASVHLTGAEGRASREERTQG